MPFAIRKLAGIGVKELLGQAGDKRMVVAAIQVTTVVQQEISWLPDREDSTARPRI